ncbi:MAG TPA: FHA domain-containing protein [Candidatus Wallbacteria bacterium]|nr:FHA domain-containing protein [Candidatus Wallbacteria bacterium]
MKRYKICPACNTKNSDAEAMCENCGVDISYAPTKTEVNSDIMPPSPQILNPTGKICPKCKADNPDYAMLCNNCQEDITGVEPSALKINSGNSSPANHNSDVYDGTFIEASARKVLQLLLHSSEENITISLKDGDVLGRCDKCNPPRADHSKCSFMKEKKDFIDCVKFNTVSRKHAKFIFENGNFYIVALQEAKNVTLINGIELERGAKKIVKSGDRLKFSSKLELYVI